MVNIQYKQASLNAIGTLSTTKLNSNSSATFLTIPIPNANLNPELFVPRTDLHTVNHASS
jgi:hypothetical protein